MSTSTRGTTEPAPPAGPGPAGRQRTFGELFAALSEHLTTLVRGEIQLAVAQAKQKAAKLGSGAALLAAAGVLGLYLLAVLLTAAILGLAVVLPAWAAALIVAGVLLVVILILALVGKKRIDASKEYTPAPQEGFKEDVEALKKGIQ